MSPSLKERRGFTLVEMVLAISVVAILATAAAAGLDPVFDSWTQGQSRSEVSGSLDVALNRMVQEISQMRDDASLTIASAGDFQFTDVNGNSIRYRLSGNQLLRNLDILARNVQSLAFTYWNINNATIASPILAPSATNLWRMSIRLSGTKGGQAVTLESHVRPRNLRRS